MRENGPTATPAPSAPRRGLSRLVPPGMRTLRELRDTHILRGDVVAGISVAMLLIPQSMAFAQLAGLPAQAGLYAAFLPTAVAALFGSSRQLITGPVSLISLLTATTLAPFALANGVDHLLQLAALLALMVGLIQLLLGFMRLGVLVDFLSHPVIIGFTNAAVIIIATAQAPKLFGVHPARAEWFHERLIALLQALAQGLHWPTVAMSAASLALLLGLKRLDARLPAVLITVVLATLAAWLGGYEQLGGRVIGAIPAGLPSLSLPLPEMQAAMQLLPGALIIAFVGYLESISIARALAAQTRQRISANQELIGQGMANLAAGISGGYPVSGSFSRSAVNLANGARTAFAATTAAAVIGLTLLFLTPLLYHLPQATLAVIVITAVAGLFRIRPIRRAFAAEPHDGIVALATFALTLAFAPRLEVGIGAGILLSMALFIYRTMRPRIALLVRLADGRLGDARFHPDRPRCRRILPVRLHMPLYYANAGHFETRLLHLLAENPHARFVILDVSAVNMIDSTGLDVLVELHERLKAHGIRLLLARPNECVLRALKRSGILEELQCEGQCIFSRPTLAICAALQDIDCPECDNGGGCPLRPPRHFPTTHCSS